MARRWPRARRKEILDHISLSDGKAELQRVYLAALAEDEKDRRRRVYPHIHRRPQG